MVYMLKYDSIHGRFGGEIQTRDGKLVVGRREYNLVILPPNTENLNSKTIELLEAYLDRKHPDWRELAGDAGKEQARADGADAPMGLEDAYDILGLQPGASAGQIRKAHRNLMKKMHPDHGGSNYLASKINEAKDLLLKQKGR